LKFLPKPKLYPKAHKSINILGYHFKFIQLLIPETDKYGRAIKFQPQNQYKKSDREPHKYGNGYFCRFHVDVKNLSGVYVLIADNEPLYIGQTCDIYNRFNNSHYGSYGFITPAAPFRQITNCKINKLVLKYFEAHNPIKLYFMQTPEHKEIEKILLSQIKTPYNG